MARNPFFDDPAELASSAGVASAAHEGASALETGNWPRFRDPAEKRPHQMPQDERRATDATPDTSENGPPDPATWRSRLRLDAAGGPTWGELMQPWQADDFAALDAAWMAAAGFAEIPERRKSWIERPRGHSKTTDAAAELAWPMIFSPRPLRGYVIAADLDQAALVTGAMAALQAANPADFADLDIARVSVKNAATGAELRLMGNDVASSFGITPDFLLIDELTHWAAAKAAMWESLSSSAAKRPHCVIAIRTNAGQVGTWQWRIREAARLKPDRWHFSSLDGPQAPWLDAAEIEQQRSELRPEEFERLWLNRWQGTARGGRRFAVDHSALVRWSPSAAGGGLLGW